MKAPRHWPLWAESTDEWWVPLTKGQQRRKCFHLMASSCKTKQNIIQSLTVYYITAMISLMSTRSVGYLGCQFQGLSVCIHSVKWSVLYFSMMTSSDGNIFRVTGFLCGEFTGHWWIPLLKASDAELWCFLWSAPLDKRLGKQSWGRWFEKPLHSLWSHCNVLAMPVSRRLSHLRDFSL